MIGWYLKWFCYRLVFVPIDFTSYGLTAPIHRSNTQTMFLILICILPYHVVNVWTDLQWLCLLTFILSWKQQTLFTRWLLIYQTCVIVDQLFKNSMFFSPKHVSCIPHVTSEVMDLNCFFLISFQPLRDRLSHCACRERAAPPKDLVSHFKNSTKNKFLI